MRGLFQLCKLLILLSTEGRIPPFGCNGVFIANILIYLVLLNRFLKFLVAFVVITVVLCSADQIVWSERHLPDNIGG